MSRLRATLLWVMGAAALLVGPALFRTWYHGEPFFLLLWSFCAAAIGGGLVGALGARVPVLRARRIPVAFAVGSAGAFAVTQAASRALPRTTVGSGMLLICLLLGGISAVTCLFFWWIAVLGSPGYYFLVALHRLGKGDREGAREAIRLYLARCEKDPEAATRRPIAERFLQDENATLDVPTELEAAAPPAGTGTELEGASAPAGRGTEPEHAAGPVVHSSDAERALRPAVSGQEREGRR